MMTLSQARLEWEQQTEKRGLEQERSVIFRLLTRRVGQLDSGLEQLVQDLSLSKLGDLGEALLDFAIVADLRDWLRSQSSFSESLEFGNFWNLRVSEFLCRVQLMRQK
jgi:Domain of unknown function (DUF4351)